MSGESKKEEFRKYLERSGVIDALTKVLVALYEEPEKPANALDFIKQYLGAPTSGDVETMKAEKDELVKKNEELTKNLEVPPAPLPCARGTCAWATHHGAKAREPPVTACRRRSVELAGSLPCSSCRWFVLPGLCSIRFRSPCRLAKPGCFAGGAGEA
jgi:hypothetical protein